MGREMVNSKELEFFVGIASESERQLRQKNTIFLDMQVSPK